MWIHKVSLWHKSSLFITITAYLRQRRNWTWNYASSQSISSQDTYLRESTYLSLFIRIFVVSVYEYNSMQILIFYGLKVVIKRWLCYVYAELSNSNVINLELQNVQWLMKLSSLKSLKIQIFTFATNRNGFFIRF